jgi:hypothetical protein
VIRIQRAIDWDSFYAKLRAVPISQVFDLLGVDTSKVGQRGGHVLCPVHRDTAPSMFVYPETNSAFCFGACWAAYDTVGLFAAGKHISYSQAAEEFAQIVGLDPQNLDAPIQQVTVKKRAEPEVPVGQLPAFMESERAVFYHKQLVSADREHFEQVWGLDTHAVDTFMLGHTPRNDWPPAYVIPVWEEHIGRDLITIRFRRDDAAAARFQVDPEKAAWLATTKYWGITSRNGLYPVGLWSLFPNDHVTLVESEKTALLLSLAGQPVLSLTGGVLGHPAAWLAWERYLLPFGRWLVIYDNDTPGKTATQAMQNMWPAHVLPFLWPAGETQDTVDMIVNQGWERFFDLQDASLDGRPLPIPEARPTQAGAQLWGKRIEQQRAGARLAWSA